MPDRPLPLQRLVLFLLAWSGIVAVITGLNFVKAGASFPSWFAPIFLAGIVCFWGMILFQIGALIHRTKPVVPKEGSIPKWIWGFSIASVVCASSLHGFAPFRPDILQVWSELPSFLRLMRFNYILTVVLQVAVITLAAAYFRGHSDFAAAGLVVIAGLMLVPNDDCPNAFNRPWISWLGASPLMFLTNSVVLLIGFCGLHGFRPRLALLFMGVINAGTLLLGLGHTTRIVW